MRRELFACYWLLSLGLVWQSTLYTFSDKLYAEAALAGSAPALLGLAAEARENHPREYREVDQERRPAVEDIVALGVKRADAEHVADAVGMVCDVFLTNDRRLRNKSPQIERKWNLRVRRPSEFLVEAVQRGAPWPTRCRGPGKCLTTSPGAPEQPWRWRRRVALCSGPALTAAVATSTRSGNPDRCCPQRERRAGTAGGTLADGSNRPHDDSSSESARVTRDRPPGP
jgi:hypothetical protein